MTTTAKQTPDKLGTQYREIAITRDAIATRAEGDDRIPIALSSEAPVERWFGVEILDHATSSVDLARAKRGLPLLLDHSTRDQIGRIEEVAIGDDKVIRGLMRFSKSARAQEIRQDVLDGIRTEASIGYQIRELVLEKSDKSAGDTYRATRWELMEGSIVAVPADPSVGVNRTQDAAGLPVRVITPGARADEAVVAAPSVVKCPGCGAVVDTAAGATCTACAYTLTAEELAAGRAESLTTSDDADGVHNSDDGAARGDAQSSTSTAPRTRNLPTASQARSVTVSGPNTAANGAAPDTRNADLAALARQYAATELLPEWIEKNVSVSEARAALLERISKNLKPMTAPVVELSEKEQKKYSIARAIHAAACRMTGEKYEDDGFEREVSQQIEKTLPDTGERHGGFFVPTNLRNVVGGQTRAGLDSATATKGPEIKFTEAGEFIDMLRARMKLVVLGARTLSGLVGPIAFPKQTAAGTFSWVGENGGADVAESNLLLGQVALAPKTGQSTTSFSKQLVAQSRTDVEALVRDDLAKDHALGIDAAGINGAGGNALTGILNTAGIGSVALGANGAVITWGPIVDLESAIAAANADAATMGYLTTPGQRGKMKQTPKVAGQPIYIWGDSATPLNGYRAEVSTQVPSNLVKGASGAVCHAIIFGDFSQLVFGDWGALEILVDPYRLKKQGMIEVTSFQMIGLAVRYPEAFAAIKDAL